MVMSTLAACAVPVTPISANMAKDFFRNRVFMALGSITQK
jgi:hypothetical protein